MYFYFLAELTKQHRAFDDIIHYAPLMMSQKESTRNHPWRLPKRVANLVSVPDSRLIVNDG